MDGLSLSLLLGAVGVALIHTLLGPDHYVPFLAMARAQHWSRSRTLTIVTVCGVAHVVSSMALASVGVAAGLGVGWLEGIESSRGAWAAWLMVAFGLAYGAWGLRASVRRRSDMAAHSHGEHVHIHPHASRAHTHAHAVSGRRMTFWTLLVVFVLGPCEPLIPLFFLPASRGRWDLALATAAVFALTTVATMLAVTAAGLAGMARLSVADVERYAHPAAGATVAAAGLTVIALGL